MTLPTIKFGTTDHPSGKSHYAEFTPEGMLYPVRVYGTTQDAVTELAWDFLDDHDRELRSKNRDDASVQSALSGIVADVKSEAISTLVGVIADMSEEIDALTKAIEFIEREIQRLERD